MVNWNDEEVLRRCSIIFQNVSHMAIGAYIIEFLGSLSFEFDMLRGRRAFRYPMLLYCYCKWALLMAFVGMLAIFNTSEPIKCQQVYTVNQWGGQTSIGAASTLLMLRTIALWPRKWIVIVPLVIISLGQWAILFHGISTVRAYWDSQANACVISEVKDVFLDLVYLYTMFTDLTVLVLTWVALRRTPGRSSLWKLIFQQGLIYFFVAFIANLIPAVFLLLDLNPVMNVMFAIPGIAASSTVACRCFVSLSTYAKLSEHGSESIWGKGFGLFRRSGLASMRRRESEIGKVTKIEWNRTEQNHDLSTFDQPEHASTLTLPPPVLTSQPQSPNHDGYSSERAAVHHSRPVHIHLKDVSLGSLNYNMHQNSIRSPSPSGSNGSLPDKKISP